MDGYDYTGNFELQRQESNIYANSDLDQKGSGSGLEKKIRGLTRKINCLFALFVVTALLALGAIALGGVPHLEQAYFDSRRALDEKSKALERLNVSFNLMTKRVEVLRRQVNAGSKYSGSRWIVGPLTTSCTQACEDREMFCRNSELEKHNSEVDSNDEVLELIKNLQPNFIPKYQECSSTYGTYSDTPSFSMTEGFCFISSSEKEKTFDCDRIPTPAYQNKSRLCYCMKVGCGSHWAASCEECPHERGKSWCNGECIWSDSSSKCISK